MKAIPQDSLDANRDSGGRLRGYHLENEHIRQRTARVTGRFTLGKCNACGGRPRAGEHAEARRSMDANGHGGRTRAGEHAEARRSMDANGQPVRN